MLRSKPQWKSLTRKEREKAGFKSSTLSSKIRIWNEMAKKILMRAEFQYYAMNVGDANDDMDAGVKEERLFEKLSNPGL